MTDPQPASVPAPPVPSPAPQESFWSLLWGKIKTTALWAFHKLLGPGIILVIVIVAIVLVAMGVKELQIGGIVAKLLGKKPSGPTVDTANSVPPERVDKEGNLIQPGTPDSKGDTQAKVVPIESPGLFSNPDTVKFTPPGETKPLEVQLPDGVKAKDVEKVIIVSPGKIVVTVKDSSGIPAQKVDDLLKRYGG